MIQTTTFQPFDSEGGLIFKIDLPGGPGSFPAERDESFAEAAWASLDHHADNPAWINLARPVEAQSSSVAA